MCDVSIRFAFSSLFAVCFSFSVLPFFFALDFRGDLPAMATPSSTVRRADGYPYRPRRVLSGLFVARAGRDLTVRLGGPGGSIERRPDDRRGSGAATRGVDPTVLPDRTAWDSRARPW